MKETRKTSHSLAGRVAGVVCLVYCLSILVIFLCNFVVNRQMLLNDAQDTLEEQLNYYENVVDEWVAVRMEHLNILKCDFENMTAEEFTEEVVLRILTESTEYGMSMGVISDYMVYPNDKMISGDGWVPDPGYRPTQNDYYKEPATSGKTYVSTPYVDATTGEFIVTISVPIYMNGKFCAVLGRDLYIDEIQTIADTFVSDDGSYLYLLDNEDNILSHANPDYAPTGTNVHNVAELSGMEFLGTLTGKNGLYGAEDFDGETKYFLEKTNATTGWTLGLAYPQHVTNQRLAFQLLVGLAIALVALLIALPILLAFLRRRLRPIQSVVVAAREIEQGNLDVKYEIQSDDEIGQLAETFRSTTDYLRVVIGEISNILDQIATGDLNVQPQCEYRGEFQKIYSAITHISDTLNDVIGGIRNASERVALGSGQVADGAQNLSQSSVEQAAQIDTLSRSCDKVAQIGADNADKCRKAGSITTEVSQKLAQSNQQMREMTEAMRRISDSSNQISAVNKTIEDIAFQTNILALNAAVEAARAGTAGKGFAVVADEVRSLASKSAEAAQNTTELVDDSIKVVGNGAQISDSTAESLQEVLSIAQQVYEIMQEIVVLSQEQAEEINQIADGIKEISGVVQLNSATAEESAAASRELSGQAQTMRDLVAHFRTRSLSHEHSAD